MLSIFSCACWPFVCLLWGNVYLGLLPIFHLSCLMLCCMSCLYILEIKPLSVALFATIFSHSEGCLCILFIYLFIMVSFAVKILWVWLGPICLFFFLFLLPLETDLRKHWCSLCQTMFSLCSLLGVLWCHVLYLGL